MTTMKQIQATLHQHAQGSPASTQEEGGRRQGINEEHPVNPTDSNELIPCPWAVRYPDKFTCNPQKGWKNWRDHVTRRPHSPKFYDYCPSCRDLFEKEEDWLAHTRPRCQGHEDGRERSTEITQRQAMEIKGLAKRGKKMEKSTNDIFREGWRTLFGDEPPTVLPYPSYISNPQYSDGVVSDDEIQKRASAIPGMEHVPEKYRVALVIGVLKEFLPGLMPRADDLADDAVQDSTNGQLANNTSQSQQNFAFLSGAEEPQNSAYCQHEPPTPGDQLGASAPTSHMNVGQREMDQGCPSLSDDWFPDGVYYDETYFHQDDGYPNTEGTHIDLETRDVFWGPDGFQQLDESSPT